MKILMLTPYLPYPLLTGGQTRSYNLIKRLASLGHEITLFSLIKHDDEKQAVSQLEKFCKEVQIFKRPEKPWTITNILRTGFSFYPFLVVRNWARGERKAIEEKLQQQKFDLIHAETFYVMPHIPNTSVPVLLVEQTIEYLVYKHYVDKFPFIPIKPLLYIDVAKLKFWEERYWKRARRVVAMSEEDKQIMQQEIPNLAIDIVPNGVDVKYFTEKVIDRSKDPVILYLGNFTWLQNREAVEVLLKKIWPSVKRRLPKAKLWIIGKGACDFFAKRASQDIRVDEVKDVRQAYQFATVLVAPIYSGGGTRLKNFETFASGLPVITTSIGIGGTDAVNGKHVIIQDNPEDIIRSVVELIKEPKKYSRLSQNALRLVKEKYDWDAIANKLSNIYLELGRASTKH